MELLNNKGQIIEHINAIFDDYQRLEVNHSQENKLFSEEVERLNQFNKRLSHELSEKDKIILCKEKTILDYENMIKELQNTKKEEGKFDMLRGQDQEIKNLTDELLKRKNEIKKLNEKISTLEEQLNSISDINVEMKVEEVEEAKDINEDENKDKDKLVKDINEDEQETQTEDLDEEPLNVEVITHYKKSYYIIESEEPQYIYNIDDDEGLGDKVGVIEQGKKVFYKNK